jgi:hypothetical protein
MRWLNIVLVILIISHVAAARIEEGVQTRVATSSISDFGAKDHHLDDGSVAGIDLSSPISKAETHRFGGGGSGLQPQTKITSPLPQDVVKISKTIEPKNKNGYYPPDELAEVIVEITSISDQELELNMIEFIDNDLMVSFPTVHGYCLTDESSMIVYEMNILNCLECNSVKSNLVGDQLAFEYHEIPIHIAKGSIKCLNKDFPNDCVALLSNQTALFNWSEIQNGSLTDYSNLEYFIKNELDVCANQNLSINKTKNGSAIIISKGIHSLATFYDVRGFLDEGFVSVYVNGTFVTHLRKENGIIYNISNVLAFRNVKLKPGNVFVFWYNIKPHTIGYFDLKTIVMGNDPGQTISEITTAIADYMPNFKVSRAITQYQNFIYDDLDILFNVEYLGGGSEPDLENVTICFDNRSKEYIYVDIEGNTSKEILSNPKITKSFTKGVSIPINIKIKLNNTGIISPPGLKIFGTQWTFNETILVDKPTSRFFEAISLFLTGIAALFLLTFKELYLDVGSNRENLSRSLFFVKGRILVLMRRNISSIIIIFILLILCLIAIPKIFDIIIRVLIKWPFNW